MSKDLTKLERFLNATFGIRAAMFAVDIRMENLKRQRIKIMRERCQASLDGKPMSEWPKQIP